ncbi:Rha family transcriptional regulator [Malikia spinosa]|uniref:Rha family transcriptional regulator n=1 Tax=Malikia spinosa TaxID=86180 RepID=A0A7C9MWQ2_9BURK|nr:Rha family transcriptional regulator [Malikia spinosa]MYZ53176.1 Rha family transcriptional regulator [Malikia spinosa]
MMTRTDQNRKPAGDGNPTAGQQPNNTQAAIVPGCIAPGKDDALALVICKDEPRIDSRLLAQHFDRPHQSLFEMVKDYRADFEKLGLLRFQTGKAKGGRPERFALLTEDQSYLLLTYTRNTAKARALKIKLIQAFGEARRAAQSHRAEYLPTYHALHDAIHARAAGSPNEKFVHMNVNKLVNQTAGIEAGQRASASFPQQSLLTVAQAIAAKAMQQAPDHRTGFQQAKTALVELSRVALIEGAAP